LNKIKLRQTENQLQYGLETLDWIVPIAYFVILLESASWIIRQKSKKTEDYFLAGRNVGEFVIGASVLDFNIKS